MGEKPILDINSGLNSFVLKKSVFRLLFIRAASLRPFPTGLPCMKARKRCPNFQCAG